MQHRKLGSELNVSALGLGCMGMTFAYGAGQVEELSLATLARAVELGVTFFDTAEGYGPFENEILVGKALAAVRSRAVRDRLVIATKFGFKFAATGQGPGRMAGLDSRPEHVREVAEASLKRLGVDAIDLLYQHRVDPAVPIEDTVGAMSRLVKEGKVRALGLSEASPATIRRAHKVHPIAAVQTEYSLWSREPEADVIPTCRELGIGFVPYSPLGRGLLTGQIQGRESLLEGDFRLALPRFEAANLAANQTLLEALARIARDKGVTCAQLAIAWVLHQGDDIVPIPGAKTVRHLEENRAAASIELTAADLAAIEAASPHAAVRGLRTSAQGMAMVDRG